MDRWIAEVTARLLWAEDIPSAQAAFRHFAREANVTYYAYANTRPGLDRPYIDSSYPELWVNHYLTNRYQFIDPVVLECQRSNLPFSWRFLINRASGLSAAQHKLFDEAAEFGIRDGFTIPFHCTEGCVAVLSYAFSSREELCRVMEQQPRLKLLGIHYHGAMERLLNVETQDEELSHMERQCLTGIANGHTLWEISGHLHRPEPDVAWALRSAREKLGASTTAQAVDKAITQGLIAQ